MMKNDDFKLLRGFEDKRTDRRMDEWMDISECRVTFVTEKKLLY